MERTTVRWHSSLTKHCLGSAFYILSTACYWSRCFVFIPVFSPVMNFICLVLHINDMFQFNATCSLSYIFQCQDLRPRKILFLHLADVGLISFTGIWITVVITESDSFIKLNNVSFLNVLLRARLKNILYLYGQKPLQKQGHVKYSFI